MYLGVLGICYPRHYCMYDTVFRGRSRLVGRGVSVSPSPVILLTKQGGGRHVSFY